MTIQISEASPPGCISIAAFGGETELHLHLTPKDINLLLSIVHRMRLRMHGDAEPTSSEPTSADARGASVNRSVEARTLPQ